MSMSTWGRKLASVALGVVCAAGIAGCGGAGGGGNTASGGGSQGPVTITLGTWGGAQENQQLQQIIDRINEQYKGKFVIKDINTPSNYDQKLNTELAAGSAPDIFYATDTNVPTYAQEGVLLDLSDLIQKYKDKAVVANPDNYFPASLQDVTYNGHYYALPWIAQPVVMYYNPNLFKQAGLPEPTPDWTWDDFMRDAKALTNPQKGIYGYLQANGWPPLEMYVWSYGGDVVNSDGTQATLNSPQAVQGLTLMENMVKQQVVPPLSKLANVDIEDLFRQGRVAMFAGGAADGNYETNGFTAKIAEMPKGTQHATYLYIADLAINAHSKVDKDLLYQAYIAILDGIDHWKVVPPVKQYAQNLQDISIPDAPGGHTPADRVPVILNSMKYARAPRVVKNMTQYWTILGNDVYQPILMGQKTAQQAADQATKDLNAILH